MVLHWFLFFCLAFNYLSLLVRSPQVTGTAWFSHLIFSSLFSLWLCWQSSNSVKVACLIWREEKLHRNKRREYFACICTWLGLRPTNDGTRTCLCLCARRNMLSLKAIAYDGLSYYSLHFKWAPNLDPIRCHFGSALQAFLYQAKKSRASRWPVSDKTTTEPLHSFVWKTRASKEHETNKSSPFLGV